MEEEPDIKLSAHLHEICSSLITFLILCIMKKWYCPPPEKALALNKKKIGSMPQVHL
jgi:hypothetical protein